MRFTWRLYQQTLPRLSFVPQSKDVSMSEVQQLQEFVLRTRRLLVITGAGLSTESGIPDYRSKDVGLYARTDRRPMQFQEFLESKLGRQRYWARNYVGWPTFSSFQPNPSHKALSEWEQRGLIKWLVTQNVDALHTKAGSKNITELHGCSHRVVCLHCQKTMERWDLQKIFAKLNPDFNETTVEIAPDGDVQLTTNQIRDFQVPDCPSCGGILKPDVIFFGDNVPRPIVNQVFGFVDECDKILVAGSSLFVYSGFRFIQRAAEKGKDIAIVNIGPTRGDKLANLKIDARCGEILPPINLDGLLK